MAMTEAQDPNRVRRRPFTTWVKKLTHFKGGASGSDGSNPKRHLAQMKIAPKKRGASKNNNPYPLSGRIGVINDPNRFNDSTDDYYSQSRSHQHSHPRHNRPRNGSQPSFLSQSVLTSSSTSLERRRSRRSSSIDSAANSDDDEEGRAPLTAGARSMAPTVSTNGDGSHAPPSVLAPSANGGGASSITGTTATSRTVNGGTASIHTRRGGGDSTFSSPAPSVRSLTTTLTTIQSLAPGGLIAAHANGTANGGPNGGADGVGGGGGAPSIGGTSGVGITFSSYTNASFNNAQNHYYGGGHHSGSHHHQHHASQQSNGTQTIHFHQPFPSTPASALPAHLTPSSGTGQPTTYSTATANNLLTDNASILTLASSSKRRRRRSLDTDASVRALAPSSLFGGSRESLPLSVLSANMEWPGSATNTAPGTSSGLNNNSNSTPPTPGAAGVAPLHTTSSRMSVASAGGGGGGGLAATAAAAERTSIYSATGILVPGGGGEPQRNSFYARQSLGGGGGGTAVNGDGASIRSGRSGRSGLLGHGRSESITGSIGGSLTSPLASPLASPRETAAEDAAEAGVGLSAVATGGTSRSARRPATTGSIADTTTMEEEKAEKDEEA